MCGIIGFNFQNPKLGKKMADSISHRGPDDEGIFSDPHVTLGNRRLAILDLSHEGHQPMPNDDKTLWIAYNGEIYNFQELRADLTKRGFRFKSNSDTEVILKGYEVYGPAVVEKLRGMWAFAIYDIPKQKIFLSRDFFGIKPLYYLWNGERFGFASELKALTHFSEAISQPLTVHKKAVGDYFVLGYIPHPSSVFKEIRKVSPGEMILFDVAAKTHTSQFLKWDEAEKKESQSLATHADLEAVLLESVEKHLLSDVPVGVFLSGGVDSTLIALLLKKLGKRLTAFTVRIANRTDADIAKKIASYAGLSHREILLDDANIEEMYHAAWDALDEPFADSSIFPSLLVSREAAKEVKVVMTGEGGDELFWGYDRYRKLHGLANILPSAKPGGISQRQSTSYSYLTFLRPLMRRAAFLRRHLRNDFLGAYIDSVAIDSGFWDHHAIINELALRYVDNAFPPVNFFDEKLYLPNDLLYKTDTATMHYSIEGRVPLLDKKVYAYTKALLPEQKLHKGVGKKILKEYVASELPRELIFRNKEGFSIPVRTYIFKNHHQELLDAIAFLLDHDIPGVPAAAYQRMLNDQTYFNFIEEKFPALLFATLSFYKVMQKYGF